MNESCPPPSLNAATLAAHSRENNLPLPHPYAERIIQFGEGNFLRGFADWMIDALNRQGLFQGRVVVVQPMPHGLAQALNAQDGLYTLLLRGIQNGKSVEQRSLVTSISRCLNPYENWRCRGGCRHPARCALRHFQHHRSRHRLRGGILRRHHQPGIISRQGHRDCCWNASAPSAAHPRPDGFFSPAS